MTEFSDWRTAGKETFFNFTSSRPSIIHLTMVKPVFQSSQLIYNRLFLSLLFCTLSLCALSQQLYTRTFGSRQDKPIIFLHGGPGYNCATFEVTTAQQLADLGFFVIVYDRRGEGRSKDTDAAFTFQESAEDIELIFREYGIQKAALVGHSFGGLIATQFAISHPQNVTFIIFVSTPTSLQDCFRNILSRCRTIYENKKDSLNLRYISMLENMDTTSLEYSSYCFSHAIQNGFYTPRNPSSEAKSIYSLYRTDSILKKYAFQMTYPAPRGFWKNESYTTIDVSPSWLSLAQKNIPLFGIYGKEDGLFSDSQLMNIQSKLGPAQMAILDNASHHVFIDQQSQFLAAIKRFMR